MAAPALLLRYTPGRGMFELQLIVHGSVRSLLKHVLQNVAQLTQQACPRSTWGSPARSVVHLASSKVVFVAATRACLAPNHMVQMHNALAGMSQKYLIVTSKLEQSGFPLIVVSLAAARTCPHAPAGVTQKYLVVTCNYEARCAGVTKLMSIAEARQKCPALVLVRWVVGDGSCQTGAGQAGAQKRGKA